MHPEIGSQITLAIITSYALQWLKGQPWFPLVSYNSENLNRLVSIAVAALSGAGILLTFDRGAGTLLITGLTLANAYHLLSHVVTQFALQHGFYRAAIAPPPPGITQSAIRQIAAQKETK